MILNPVIASITLRQLLSRRRTLLLVLLGAILVVVALVKRVSSSGPEAEFTAHLLSDMGIAVLMPLVALIFGTGAMGAELDEGTAIYILAKPINRATVLVTKLIVAIGCSIVLTSVPLLLGGLLAGGEGSVSLSLGFAAAGAIGSAVYCAIFVALSLVTSRAFIFGLAYVLVWEGFLAGLFAGTRTLSVRELTLAFAQALANPPSTVFSAELPIGTAIVVAVIVTVIALVIAVRRMRRVEIAGETT